MSCIVDLALYEVKLLFAPALSCSEFHRPNVEAYGMRWPLGLSIRISIDVDNSSQ